MKQAITLSLFLVITGVLSAQIPYKNASPDARVISKEQVMKAKAKMNVHNSDTRDIYEMYVDYSAANFDDLFYVWQFNSGYTNADTALNYNAVEINNFVGYTDPADPIGSYIDWYNLGLDDSFPSNVSYTIDSIFVAITHENNTSNLDYLEMRIVKTTTSGAPNTTPTGILWSQKDSTDVGLSPENDWLGSLVVLGYGPEYTPAPGQKVATTLIYTNTDKLDTLSILSGAVDDGTGAAYAASIYATSWLKYPPFLTQLYQNVDIVYVDNQGNQTGVFDAQNWIYWYRVTINTVVGIADNFDNLKVTGITPNPASGKTNILYGLKEATNVNMDLYDISGRFISHLYDGNDGAGSYIRNLDVSNLSNGTYLVSTTAGEGSPVVSRMVVSH